MDQRQFRRSPRQSTWVDIIDNKYYRWLFLFAIIGSVAYALFHKNHTVLDKYRFEKTDGKYFLYIPSGNQKIPRMEGMTALGWSDKFVIGKNEKGVYWLNSNIDDYTYPAKDIVRGPYPLEKLGFLVDSLKMKNFKFRKPKR